MGIKVVTIIGARPQFVKAATVSRQFNNMRDVNETIIHTGQHYDENMSAVFFSEMQLPEPKYNLGIHGSSHGVMTGEMMIKLEPILVKEKPDIVLVYGDTNSTLAGALCAAKLHLKVAHVEAGMRSFNNDMPEEINRILTDRISNILFCSTATAITNLRREGYGRFPAKIVKSGDVMYDAALYYSQIARKQSKIIRARGLTRFALCTIHRAENTDSLITLKSIVSGLNKISQDIRLIVPLHPRTKQIIKKHKIHCDFESIDPVGYFDMIELLRNCQIVLTDSGGVQKEAYFFKKFCITLREETEWVELVKHKVNILAGSRPDKIYEIFAKHVNKRFMRRAKLYGTGQASKIIARELIK